MRKKRSIIYTSLVAISLFAVFSFWRASFANAVSAGDWKAGNIMDDAVFANDNDMSVEQIQDFLNSKVPSCDTNGTQLSEFGGGTRAEYGASRGNPAPFTCLKDYYEVPKTSPTPELPANNYGGKPIPAGAQSAARLIYNAAQKYDINPKVLLVKLGTESAGPLTTDDWPFLRQYTYAMGSHCPDSGPGGSANCDSNYGGFSMQMDSAANLLRWYIDSMDESWWPYKKPFQNNHILWNVVERGCGGSDVYIETKATAALYTYTPYQPNQAALNNMYGTGDYCSAYGNRNFWRVYNDWFGSTRNGGIYLETSLKNNLAPNTKIKPGEFIVSPSGRYVTTMQTDGNMVTYMGKRAVWSSKTYGNYGSHAVFQSDGNLVIYRPNGTAIWASNTYQSGATLVTLQDDGNLYVSAGSTTKFSTNILVNPYAQRNLGSEIPSETRIRSGDFLLSRDRQQSVVMQPNGDLALYINGIESPLWSSKTYNNSGAYAVIQNDGNFVIYTTSNRPIWSSKTYGAGASTLKLQDDGNLVTYKTGDIATWSAKTWNNAYMIKVHRGSQITSETRLMPMEYLRSPDYRYTLVMQNDGNLVLYSAKEHRPLWSSKTYNNLGAYAIVQNDGNLVVYTSLHQAVWSSKTNGAGASTLKMQDDGNLVMYKANGAATWSSKTNGHF